MTRPVPVADEQSAPYWEAAKRGTLVHARCSNCGKFNYPVDVVCGHCYSTHPDYTWDTVTGNGTVRSWTVIHQSFLPGFDVPFLLVDVELVEQSELRMIARLLDGPDADVHLGDPVSLAFETLPDVVLPAFRLARSA